MDKMSWKGILQLVLVLATFAKISDGQRAVYVCKHTTVTGSEFEIVFKYFRNSDPQATGLTSYDASADPNTTTPVGVAACKTQILEEDVYTLQYTVDVNASLPCGIVQDMMLPTMYKVAIVADGTSTLFTFACNTSDLQLPNQVIVESFATGHLQNIDEFTINQNSEAKFWASTPDGRLVNTVNVGENVKLRWYQDVTDTRDTQSTYIPDNFGTVFHTAYPWQKDFFIIKIYTLCENLVTVQVILTVYGDVQELLVNTTKSTPAILTLNFDSYIPQATFTNWTIIDYGLKIQSLAEEIGVILNDNQTSIVVHPDEVLGKQYRALSAVGARCLIIGTEDNTTVTFDLSNYPLSGLEIAGRDFSFASEATVIIHEYKAVELACVDNCVELIIKSSKKVAVIIGFHARFLQIPETSKLYRNFIIHKSPFLRERKVLLTTGDSSLGVDYTHNNITEISNGTTVDEIGITNLLGVYLYSTGPILAVQEEFLPSIMYLSYSVVSSITQWSTKYYFFMESQKSYTVLVTTFVPNLNSISMVTPNGTVKLDALPNHRTSHISTALGVSYNDYEVTISVDSTLYTEGLYEFSSGETGVLFGIYVLVTKDSFYVEPIMPFGMKFPCVNQSTGDIVSCEHVTDNESSDDPSSLTIRLKPKEVMVSDTSTFSGRNVWTLLSQGCNTNVERSVLPAVSSFTRVTNITNGLMMETDVFKMFRFRGSYSVFFRLKLEICVVETGDCDIPCTSRTKRSTASNHVDLELSISDGNEDNNTSGKSRESCESTIIYWIPHSLLLMIIIIEVVATSYFLMKKWKLKQS